MTKSMTRLSSKLLAGLGFVAALSFGAPALAQADFASGNAALLDPFDPVPQIHFSDCYDSCGYRDCYDRCGYRRCYDRCGYRRRWGWRHHDDWGFGRRLWQDDAAFWQRIYQYDFNTHRWNDAMDRYSNQADRYDHYMRWGPTGPHDHGPDPADYAWQQGDGGHWRYWHNHGWHDDGEDDHWHDGHHDRHDDHHDDHHDGH